MPPRFGPLRQITFPLRFSVHRVREFKVGPILLSLGLAMAALSVAVAAPARAAPQTSRCSPQPPPSWGQAIPPGTILRGDAPLILYTDLASGPNHGGEHNDGTYLSIFGKRFGTGGLGSRVKVLIGEAAVAGYRYLGPSKGRPDIEEITVQIGSLGNPALGVPLPVEVVVDGLASNTNHTFTVTRGRILFVDNVHGNDNTARVGDIKRPFRHVQTPDLSEGAWGSAEPGDIIVMRGTRVPWTDVGFEHYFMRYRDKSGTPPGSGRHSGPIAIIGYPGEDVFIHGTLAAGITAGCISAINGQTYPGIGQWAVIADLRIDCEGYDGPISQEIYGDHWRVINNDLSASTAPTAGPHVPRMAGITGNGCDAVWLGNHIHDIQGSVGEAHGIYIDGDGSYDIAYNLIEHIRSGNGFQTFANGDNGSSSISYVRFHHNLIRDVAKHGINIADSSRDHFLIYDNIISDTACSGIRFNTLDLRDAFILNNTFYDTDTSRKSDCAALANDWRLRPDALTLENNIFVAVAGTAYAGGEVNFPQFPGIAADNVFYGGTPPTLGELALTARPAFIDPSAGDFRLRSPGPGSGAAPGNIAPVIQTDYDLNTRSAQRPEIGALVYVDHR